MLEKSIDSTRKNFIEYLDNLGLSPKTHKNYRSDLTHFTGWVILRIRSFGSYIETLTEAVPFLNKNLGPEYKAYLTENKIPLKTINRRLSTLRHLGKFLVLSGVHDQDFMEGIENVGQSGKTMKIPSQILSDFQGYLVTEKVSKNTIKNYVSDARQFLTWLEKNQSINY